MPTPKLNRLAQMFMQRIQDPILLDGLSPEKFLPGSVVRTAVEIEEYIHRAGMMFFQGAWMRAQPTEEAPGSLSHKRKFLNAFPELFKFRSVTVAYASSVSSVDLTVAHNDVYDVLDSVKSGGGGIIEVWDPTNLADAIAEANPFLITPRVTSANPGMILSQPTLYVFPNNIADPAGYTFTLNFIQNIKNPTPGDILRTGGTYDVPFSEAHLDTMADIAAGIFNKDDFQEDSGG